MIVNLIDLIVYNNSNQHIIINNDLFLPQACIIMNIKF